jgi:predicted AAA+ superfamily ATPase
MIKKGVEVLTTANIIQPIYNVSIASLPFTNTGKRFKLIFVDIGLLLCINNIAYENLFFNQNLNAILSGSWAEQYAAQQLISNQQLALHYWARSKNASNAEVDYVLEKKGLIIPIKVKSGVAGKLRSLHVLFAENPHITQAIIYSKAPLGVVDKMNFVPIYYAGVHV